MEMIDPYIAWVIAWILQGIAACCAIFWFIGITKKSISYLNRRAMDEQGEMTLSDTGSPLRMIITTFIPIITLIALLSVISINIGQLSPIGGLYGVPFGAIAFVIFGLILAFYINSVASKKYQKTK